MHPCALLLGEVETLLHQEEQALTNEDVEAMSLLCDQRISLMSEAWDAREGYDEEMLKKRLAALHSRQSLLTLNAKALCERLGDSLRTTRKQGKYYAVCRQQNAMNQKSNYITKVS